MTRRTEYEREEATRAACRKRHKEYWDTAQCMPQEPPYQALLGAPPKCLCTAHWTAPKRARED